jgi:Integrase zinc binding domain
VLGTQHVRVLVSHGVRHGRGKLLDIPLGEIGSRWIAGSEHKVYGKVASLFSQPYVTPPGNDTAELSPQQIILLAQSSAIQEFERGKHSKVTACRDEPRQQVRASDMRMMKNALWIPERAIGLQLHLFVETHCRFAGHRAHEATLGTVKDYVAWAIMTKYVKVFVKICLHCVATVPRDKVQRPLSTLLHALKPDEMLHFDFLCIGLSIDGNYQFKILLKDNLIGHPWLVTCQTANYAATVDALMCQFDVSRAVIL